MFRMTSSLILISILVHLTSSFLQPQPTCTGCPTCQNANGCPSVGGETSETTTESSESTTLGYYEQYWQGNGWKTDDAGNVYVGDDNAKLLLIQQGSYCPVSICKGWFGIW
uniref:Secreted protein n=1 Tax=Caenorhabditis tropicalis TaxID=1561998 RepID=A0A1I7UA74_9PELO